MLRDLLYVLLGLALLAATLGGRRILNTYDIPGRHSLLGGSWVAMIMAALLILSPLFAD